MYLGNMQNDKKDSILISKVGRAEADEREAAAAKIQVLLNRFQFLNKKLLFSLILFHVRNKIKEILEAMLNAGWFQRPPDTERFEIKGKRKGRHQQEGS